MRTLLIFVFLISGFSLFAQVKLIEDRFKFESNLDYRADIPSPTQFLDYSLGAEFTVYARVVDYFKALAETSDRVLINQYGTTYEGRPLINLVISSSENIQNIDQLRQEHQKLTNPLAISTDDAEALIKTQPVFTSISYNIHGNETSSTEAAMQVAYRLAAAQDQETDSVLNRSLIILYICINPDGRDRYVYWYKGMKRSVVGFEPKDLEHYAPWPNGRTNHYWFDLNRDWIWGVHPESRGHTTEYQKWMPQVHVDYHEMGYNSNYFTMPGTTPRNKLLPDNYEALSDTFGHANIAAFDKNQINYFTRDAFDFFYPGYGSSYPSVMGAIGMLVEQGGIGGGRAIKTNDDYILTLRQRIFDHYTTSWATIKKAAEHKELLLRYSFNAWNPKSSKTKTQAYLLPASQEGYLNDVLQILNRQRVEIGQLDANLTSEVKDYRTGKKLKKSFPKGTYIISTNQARSLFLNSIMERNMAIEDSVMYDMATWSAPLAYNLDAFSTDQQISTSTSPAKISPASSGRLTNPKAQYAYVIDWKQRHAPKALARLWKKGYRVRSATKAFGNSNQSYSRGSLIILRGRNRHKADSIENDIRAIALETAVTIDGHNTGRMLKGMDLASNKNRPLKPPQSSSSYRAPL